MGGMLAESRNRGHHVVLPKQLPNCGVDTLLLRESNKNMQVGLLSNNFDVRIMQAAMEVISATHCGTRLG